MTELFSIRKFLIEIPHTPYSALFFITKVKKKRWKLIRRQEVKGGKSASNGNLFKKSAKSFKESVVPLDLAI